MIDYEGYAQRGMYRAMAIAIALIGGHIPVTLIRAFALPRWTLVIPGIALIVACIFLAKSFPRNSKKVGP